MSFLDNQLQFFKEARQSYKVGFIVIGAQKSGTTALDRYLRTHSEICMANKKEVHYFDRKKYFKNNNPDYSKYHKFFKPSHKHKIVGESTPIYIYWNQAIQRIHLYNPKIKLIAILRNPIYRAFSHWNMERERNRERRSFFDAINDENRTIKSIKKKQDRTFSYLDRGCYYLQLKKIFKFFNKNQLLIIKNESLRSNPNSVLSQIATFLSIPSFQHVEHKEVHSRVYSTKLSNRELEFLRSFYEEEINNLEDLLGWDLASWKV